MPIPYSRLIDLTVPVGESVHEIPAPSAGTLIRWGANQNDGPKDGYTVTLWNAEPSADWHEAGRPEASRAARGKGKKEAPKEAAPKEAAPKPAPQQAPRPARQAGVTPAHWEPAVALVQLVVPAGEDQAAEDKLSVAYQVAAMAGEGRRKTCLWARFTVAEGTGDEGQAPRPVQLSYTILPASAGE